jgi:hypothetical protein
MKKEMNSTIKSSIFSVDRNFINIKQLIKILSLLRQLASKESCLIKKRKRDNVTISCHSFSQMISIMKNQ